ncbi:Pvc16 family protein [Collimonas humicola]|uniref:Pvc16 family protein n=1 Tax=Collimonas humicola TaxID=2825886 RepID=UPI001B8BACFE|nr:Pvc16 family protein [Collimonas humicola]
MPVLTDNQSEDEIATLNATIDEHIKNYLTGMSLDLSWDAPDPANPPADPILHLFLYLIHEDLELRHGDTPRYLPESRRFEPRRANVRCLYLVTYWEKDGSGGRGGGAPASAPDSQAVRVLNRVTKALLSMRTHPDLQHCSVRVIEPEALNSLGNFWQSLGDKPKTIINFAVTLPISFEKPTDVEVPIVYSNDVQLGQGSGSWEIQLEHYLLEGLRQALRDSSVPVNAMSKVVLQVTPVLDASRVARENPPKKANIQVTGVALASVKDLLAPLIETWQGSTVDLANESITLQEVQNTIIAIADPVRH